MSDPTRQVPFEVKLPPTELTKLERERRAFFRLLPQLLNTHRGQYAAIHDEQVVDSGSDQLEVAMRVWKRVGPVDVYVGLVTDEPELVFRSEAGKRRLP
jgi:hypothetical protein